MTILKEFFNFLFDPRLFFAMCVGTLILLIWKREFFEGGAVWIEGATADPDDEHARQTAERVACA